MRDTAIAIVLAVMLSDFFDTMGTVIGIGGEAKLLDKEGRLPGIQRVLLVDSLAAAAGGAASASSNTTYIESAAGVSEGGRTGLTSVVVGVLFLAAMFLSPIAGDHPPAGHRADPDHRRLLHDDDGQGHPVAGSRASVSPLC